MAARSQIKVAYRLAGHRVPLRNLPSAAPGRFHRPTDDEPTHYACLHPLGPWAEFMRANGIDTPERAALIAHRVWVLRADLEPLTRITFETAELFGITPAHLVSADQRHCRDLADRMRAEGARGLIVPSAALPGTENLVLFGRRAAAPYLTDPVDIIDVPASIVADRARPDASLVNVTRHRGVRTHAELSAYKRGEDFVFSEPLIT